jgi:hypothetical protein
MRRERYKETKEEQSFKGFHTTSCVRTTYWSRKQARVVVVVVAVVLLLTFLDVWLLQVEIRSHFSRKSLSLSKLMAVVTSETHRLLLPLPNGQESSSTSSGPTSSHRFKEEEEKSVPVLRRHLTLLDGIRSVSLNQNCWCCFLLQ